MIPVLFLPFLRIYIFTGTIIKIYRIVLFRYFGPPRDGSNKKMAVFASDRGLEILSRTNCVALDGTFKTSPPPFLQLFVIQVNLGYLDRPTTDKTTTEKTKMDKPTMDKTTRQNYKGQNVYNGDERLLIF